MSSPSLTARPDQPTPRRQGTVATFDPEHRSGSVISDDGQSHTFCGDALDAQLRLLRPGQRVHWLSDDHGDTRYLTLITLPVGN
jgi:2-phospho-L-lactate guanylyltransferase